MPLGKHNSSDKPDRGNSSDRARDSARDPTRDSARDPGRERPHDPARDPDAGEHDEVVTVEHLLAPGAPSLPTPPAGHARYAYVLEGQVTARIGAETLIAGPGSIVSLPAGFRHSLACAGDTTARVLVVHVRETEREDSGGAPRRVAHAASRGAMGEPRPRPRRPHRRAA